MALTETEETATSLLPQGGVQTPAVGGPEEVQVAGLGSIASKLSQQVAPVIDDIIGGGAALVTGKTGSQLNQARKQARDIKAQPDKKPEVDELGQSPLPEAPQQAQPGVDPAVKAPEHLIPKHDPWDNYIRVGDNEVDFVMNAPERRDELLGEGLSDFNSNKVPDTDGVQERMEQISRLYPSEISKGKRDKITFEAARQVADLVGGNAKSLQKVAQAVLERRQGQGINVEGLGMMESMLAARDLLVSEIRKLDHLAELAERGELSDLAKFRHQVEFVANLQKQIKGAQTEYARTLAGFNIPARASSMNPHVAADAAAKTNMDLSDLLDGYGGAESVQEMARKYRELQDPAQRAALTRGLNLTRKLGNALYEVWQHALLTNPISQTKNIISGIYTTFIAPNLELAGGVALGAVRRGITGADDGAKLTQLQAQMFGQIVALREAFVAAGRDFTKGGLRGYTPSKIEGSEAGALGGKPGEQRIPAFSGEAFGQMGPIGTGIDVLGNLLTAGRVAYRTLEGGDTVFKVISRRGELYAQALMDAQARGKEGDDLVSYVAEFVADPPAETINKMEQVAKYNTLQTELDEVGKAINKIGKLPILRYFVPFIKTPYNAAKYSFVDRSPITGVGALLGRRWGTTGAMIQAGGAQRDEAIARISLGTTMGITVAGLAYTGDISGGGPANPGLRQDMMARGWQPYSVKLAGRWYSYQGFEPLSSIVGVWADAVDILTGTEWDDDDLTPQDVLGAAIGATLYNVSNKTFMQGFATLAQIIQDPHRYTGQMVDKFGKTVVPRGIVNLKRTGVHIPGVVDAEPDPVIRDARNFLDNIKAQIPGLSATLKPALDEWGEDKVRGVSGVDGKRNLALGPDRVSPIYLRDEIESGIDEERHRLGGIYLNNTSDELNLEGLREPITLPDEMRYFRNQHRGRLAKNLLNIKIKSREYLKLKELSEAGNDEVTRRMRQSIQGVYADALTAADEALLQHPVHGPALQLFIEELYQDQKDADNIGVTQ